MFKKISAAATSAGTTLFLMAGTVLAANDAGSGSSNNTGGNAFGTAIKPSTGYSTDFGALINFILTLVMIIALLLVLLYLVLGGIEWITSGGDKSKTESARNKITAAVIGIIILAASYALVQLVAYVLGFNNFSDAIQNVPQIGGK